MLVMKTSIVNILSLGVSLVWICSLNIACSTLGGGNTLEDPGFKKRVGNMHQAVPLPVEIAKDIERISEDGLLVYNENPSYSRAFNVINNQVPNSSLISSEDPEMQGEQTEVLAEGAELPNKGKNSLNPNSEDILTEDDLSLREETGPLALTLRQKKNGPLNFKQKMAGSGLKPLQGGKTVSYVVKLGDTLMKIAFEKYANYLRWKDIYKINKNKISAPERMKVGTELTIKNVKYVYIQRDGQPYLIRKMDTLKSISKKLYGTSDRWEDIWKNNPQLIRNPKKIYAGFTLYYQKPDKLKSIEMRQPTSKSTSSKK